MESISQADVLTTVATLQQSADESALLLIGERGLGKSHLLGSAHAAQVTSSVLVRAHPAEAQFPLAGFASLFAALRQEPASEFQRYFTLRSQTPDALFAAAYDLLALIRGLDLSPTVALIDDLDRMDAASRVVLGTIASHLSGTSLWLVATASDAQFHETLPGFTAAQLLPLTADEIVEIAAHDTDHDEATLHILARYAGGNPRVLAEQVDRLHDDQSQGAAPLILPPRATHTIEQVTTPVLGSLGTTAHEILDLVALAPMSHVAVIGQVVPEGADDVEDLVDAGLLRRRGAYLTFTDQRLRSRLYWDQSSKSRRESHAQLAEACLPHDERLAIWHRSSATRAPEGVDELVGAAISLVDDGHIGAAIEFTERALTRAEHLANHTASFVRLCHHLLRDGQLYFTDRYSARIQITAPEHTMDILNIRLMARLFQRQHVVDDELLALADLHGEANPEGASTMLLLGAAYRSERWEIDEARRLTDRALAIAEDASESTRQKLAAMSEIIDGLEGTSLDGGSASTDLDIAAVSADPDLLLLRARVLTVHEAYQEARQLFTIVTSQATSREGLRKDLTTYGIITNEICAGEYRSARAAIDTWDAGPPTLTGGTAFMLMKAWYAYSIGADDEAEELIERSLELASQEASQGLRARALALRGAWHLQTGDNEAAIADLRHVSAASIRFRNPTLLRHWANYTEACVLTDRVQEAAATVTALERRLSAHHSRWGELALMRARALVEPGKPSLALFDDAVKAFGRNELPYELGRTLRSFAIRQEELGMVVDSRRTRMAAVAAFEAAGADAWADRTDRPVGASVAGDEGQLLDQLSSDERDVAIRVIQGLRNREIAHELFVSVRTVELRLTHIYRTFGVHSRAQLVAELTGAAVPDDTSLPGGDEPHS